MHNFFADRTVPIIYLFILESSHLNGERNSKVITICLFFYIFISPFLNWAETKDENVRNKNPFLKFEKLIKEKFGKMLFVGIQELD